MIDFYNNIIYSNLENIKSDFILIKINSRKNLLILEYKQNDFVSNIKKKIELIEKIPTESQILKYDGKVLSENSTLAGCKILNKSIILYSFDKKKEYKILCKLWSF